MEKGKEGQRLKKRISDEELSLVPYYPAYEITLPWYQNRDVCRQVDNRDELYDLDRLKSMYSFLSENGDCYYIQYKGKLVGDVTLRDNNEVCIVVCKEYQNLHIGRRCIREIINIAVDKGISEITANIYDFNTQSQRMFIAAGFQKNKEERYSYRVTE